jgi:AraC family transcriptional regulator
MSNRKFEGSGKRSAADRKIQREWMFAENSIFNRVDSYSTENLTLFPSGRIEVRQFSWSRPMESVWETGKRCYLFNMSLGNQEPTATVTHLDSGLQKQIKGRGALAFVPPGQKMSSSFGAGNSRSVCCMLDAHVVDSFLTDTPTWNWSPALLNDCAHVGGTEIHWLLRRMYREVQEPDFATAEVLEALAKQLAVEIVRKFKLRGSTDTCYASGLSPWRMRLIRERLHSEVPLPDLEEMAALCDITVRHLTRGFRTATGQTLGRHIASIMVERAKVQLEAGVPVGQVAKRLGYSSSGAFAAAFRRATGMQPSEVRMARFEGPQGDQQN